MTQDKEEKFNRTFNVALTQIEKAIYQFQQGEINKLELMRKILSDVKLFWVMMKSLNIR